MLRELDEYGFTELTGVDYAIGSVELAKKICSELKSIYIFQSDLLNVKESVIKI